MHLIHRIILAALVCGLLPACGSSRSLPPADQLPTVAQLPDPFLKADGGRVGAPSEWPAQRAWLIAQIEQYAYGHAPPDDGRVEASEQSAVHDDALHATRRTLLLGMGPGGKLAVHLHLTVPDGAGPFAAIVDGDVCWGRLSPEIVAEALKRGYLLAEFDRTEVAPDKADRSIGLYALYPQCDGGAIAAWAWGYRRVVDALLARHEVDAKRVCITGHSRGGKATLLAGALDERIALVAPNGSGCFGAGCLRFYEKDKAEDLEHIVARFPYWFTPGVSAFVGHVERLPFDAHTLKALVAPRALLATEGLGDLWANPSGTQLTWQAGKVVYDWFGAGDRIGIAYRPGGHAHSLPDWLALLDFADHQLFGKAVERRFDQLPYPDRAAASFMWTAPH